VRVTQKIERYSHISHGVSLASEGYIVIIKNMKNIIDSSQRLYIEQGSDRFNQFRAS